MDKVPFESLDPTIQDLLRQAADVRTRAYCPYSNFQVGACVRAEDGATFTGCNVENVAHGSICAERTAYCKAVSEGRRKFTDAAVVAFHENAITTPCGNCRQFMSEFGNVNVYLAKPSLKEVYVSTLDVLLPFQFKM